MPEKWSEVKAEEEFDYSESLMNVFFDPKMLYKDGFHSERINPPTFFKSFMKFHMPCSYKKYSEEHQFPAFSNWEDPEYMKEGFGPETRFNIDESKNGHFDFPHKGFSNNMKYEHIVDTL